MNVSYQKQESVSSIYWNSKYGLGKKKKFKNIYIFKAFLLGVENLTHSLNHTKETGRKYYYLQQLKMLIQWDKQIDLCLFIFPI